MSSIIAVTGKGGAGKTVLSSLMIRILGKERGARVLAIDADSAISLSYALGVEVGKTLSDFRSELIDNPATRKEVMSSHIRTFIEGIVQPGDGFDLLVMGRSEGPGCFCSINDLLRYGIENLSRDYDFTVVDGEAGPEQINRRVMQSIDILVILTDTSIRGFKTAGVIGAIAGGEGAANLGRKGLVINRLKASGATIKEAAQKVGQEVFGYIPEDRNVTEYDLVGKPILDLPASAPSVKAVKEILARIGVV